MKIQFLGGAAHEKSQYCTANDLLLIRSLENSPSSRYRDQTKEQTFSWERALMFSLNTDIHRYSWLIVAVYLCFVIIDIVEEVEEGLVLVVVGSK